MRHALRDVVEDVCRAALIGAAERERDDLRTGVLHRSIDEVKRIFARTEDETAGELVSAENKLVCHSKNLLCVLTR